ncbi:PREDICTED: INO80 complex subunit D-like [Amphimedon queenslandica]|uniref:KANL2-like probable zinc-finger domain-containing protein n=1 Tax=Amphimedon queenslandica TaxID=400682 RepID=A0A1X7V8S2_AMPQE|nr:PREDICTED: INO80 complex subunit D-like [Amphimedon queenslandica]|eukprot:XP_019850118.1 PREDICTED: INO80 complex subunit D-like [Amphimedon queenslandica]
MSSCKFPEKRRLDVSSETISIDPKLKTKAKEIVNAFISTTKEDTGSECDVIRNSYSSSDVKLSGTWSDRSDQIKSNLLKEISSLKRRLKFNEERLVTKRDSLLQFIRLARANSLLAADLLHEGRGGVSAGRGQLLRKQRIRCCKVISGKQCNETALLYTRYCLGHITEDKRQVLYQCCSSMDADTSTKCNRPVLEILQDKPHCLKHISETKKTMVKLPLPSNKTQGPGLKHRVSPGLQKIRVHDTIKRASALGLPSPLQPPPPLSSSFLPPPLSATWSLTESERNNRTGLGSPTKEIISPSPTPQTSELSPFSLDTTNLLPPPPPVLLLPPDPTPGSFFDDDTSSDEVN